MIKTQAGIPTLGMIELSSVARGLLLVDQMLKRAEVQILFARAVGSGKYVIILTGDEASLFEAVTLGRELAELYLKNFFYIPSIHPDVVRALSGHGPNEISIESIGIFESSSIASTVRMADIAVKCSAARLLEITFELDLGGKGYFTLSGDLADVQASIESATEAGLKEGTFVNTEIIPAPHPEMHALVKGD